MCGIQQKQFLGGNLQQCVHILENKKLESDYDGCTLHMCMKIEQ
jgi:hypothetical protein